MSRSNNIAIQLRGIKVIIPCLIISMLTLLDITGVVRAIFLSLCLIPYFMCLPKEELLVLFFFVGFTADINVDFVGIPYITLLQLVFVGKLLFRRGIKNTYLFFVVMIIILQMYAIAFCGLSFVKLVTFILNLLLMYSVGYALDFDNNTLHLCYSYFVIGIAVVLFASIRRDPMFFSGVYYRFKGIWPDQNFLALFCGIACLLVYYGWIKEKEHYVLSTILMTLFVYCGYRTYSMTFIFCVALVFGLMLVDLLSSNIKLFFKVAAVIVVIIAGIYVFSIVYAGIVDGRGREVFVAGTDWTHGRFRDTEMVIRAWEQSVGNILFGFGINNSSQYVHVAAHNTYVEILSQTGLLGTILILALLVSFCINNKFKIKHFFTLQNSFLLVLLFYMVTLSMESTDLLYLLFGIGIGNVRRTQVICCSN